MQCELYCTVQHKPPSQSTKDLFRQRFVATIVCLEDLLNPDSQSIYPVPILTWYEDQMCRLNKIFQLLLSQKTGLNR